MSVCDEAEQGSGVTGKAKALAQALAVTLQRAGAGLLASGF